MREIIGNTTATPNPRPDWAQTDSTKADYIRNKPTKLSDFENDIPAEEIYVPEEIYVGDGDMPKESTIQIILDASDEEQALKDELKDYIDEELAKFPGGGTGGPDISVTDYDAKGDGKTDDTNAFQKALAENRTVYVPGGTYKLTGSLVIGANCELELAQDAVLNFTQTSGNCITLKMMSSINGNHATIKVPYEFSGNVIYAYSADSTNADQSAVPGFTKWGPQWKSARYVTNLNILKSDSRGFHYSVNGDTYGTAVYISANQLSGYLTYMWGVNYSGIRIAGAFEYGIRAVCLPANIDPAKDGWLHEMCIDAFIEGCETGVSLEDCPNVYLSAIVQPLLAYTMDEKSIPYAKYGIKLVRSPNADLSGSRVWDWNGTKTLWTEGGEYQHIAMYGDCKGTIINDFAYYINGDTRNRIFTDTMSNLEKITILQEPITRWFKPTEGEPYFFDGVKEQKLLTKDTLDSTYFTVDSVQAYTDVLATATDTDGVTIFNEIGYQKGVRFDSLGTGTELTPSSYYMVTGFIPVKPGSKVCMKNLSLSDTDYVYAGIVFYDSSRTRVANLAIGNIATNAATSMVTNYTETVMGCSLEIANSVGMNNLGIAYMRMSFPMTGVGIAPAIAIDEEIKETIAGFLAPDIKVHAENVVGLMGGANALPYYLTQTYNESNTMTCDRTVAEIESAYASGRDIKIRAYVDAETMYIMGLFYIGSSDNGYVFGFENSLAKRFLNPQADGTYVITTSFL